MKPQEFILTSILHCRRSDLYLHPYNLTESEQSQFDSMMARFNSGEPLQYILGECEFFGLKIKVDRRVLIPRPETEILVEQAVEKLKNVKDLRILEIGTGSGNIPIVLVKNLNNAIVTTMDCSLDAIEFARENARLLSVEEKINFVHANILEVETWQCHVSTEDKFDLIISNPPYIPSNQLQSLPNDVQKEPKIALDGGVDGLKFYRVIIKQAQTLLKAGGWLMLEIGDGQREGIEMLLGACGQFREIEFHKDYVGTDRIMVGQKVSS